MEKKKTIDFGQEVEDTLHDLRAWYLNEGFSMEEATLKCLQQVSDYYFKME